MKTIGLTGGIATGKSTVGSILRELGIPVYSADQLAHDAIRKGTPLYHQILAEWGQELLREDGEIDRKQLGKIVFADAAERRKLEGMIHPVVIAEIQRMISEGKQRGEPVLVFEVPLLFEVNLEGLFDLVWVVSLPPEEQLNRLMRRDRLTRAEAIQRVNAQLPLAIKEGKADAVINDQFDLDTVRKQIIKILNSIGVTWCKHKR